MNTPVRLTQEAADVLLRAVRNAMVSPDDSAVLRVAINELANALAVARLQKDRLPPLTVPFHQVNRVAIECCQLAQPADVLRASRRAIVGGHFPDLVNDLSRALGGLDEAFEVRSEPVIRTITDLLDSLAIRVVR